MALKIFRLEDPTQRQKKLALAEHEHKIVQHFGSSENIIRYHELNADAEETLANIKRPVAYIAMEPVNGGDFFDWVAFSGAPFGEEITRYFFLQILKGVDLIHSKGYFHGDLKPENILMKVSHLSDCTKIGETPWFSLKETAMTDDFETSANFTTYSQHH